MFLFQVHLFLKYTFHLHWRNTCPRSVFSQCVFCFRFLSRCFLYGLSKGDLSSFGFSLFFSLMSVMELKQQLEKSVELPILLHFHYWVNGRLIFPRCSSRYPACAVHQACLLLSFTALRCFSLLLEFLCLLPNVCIWWVFF